MADHSSRVQCIGMYGTYTKREMHSWTRTYLNYILIQNVPKPYLVYGFSTHRRPIGLSEKSMRIAPILSF